MILERSFRLCYNWIIFCGVITDMNDKERKKAVGAFVERWTSKGYEKGESFLLCINVRVIEKCFTKSVAFCFTM